MCSIVGSMCAIVGSAVIGFIISQFRFEYNKSFQLTPPAPALFALENELFAWENDVPSW